MNCIVEIKHLYKSIDQSSVLDNIRFFIDEKSFIVIDKKVSNEDLVLYNIMELTHDGQKKALSFDNKRILPYNQQSRVFLNDKIRRLSEFVMIVDKTVKENIALSIDEDIEDKEEMIRDILMKTELLKYKDIIISECSQDIKQMVLFSEVLLNSHKLIFIDDLNDFMSVKNRQLVISLLKEIHLQGNAVIVVGDDEELKEYSQKVVEIKRKE